MDRKTQTRSTRAYSPLIYNLRRTVAADIVLPMDAVTIDATHVEVALRFFLAKIAIYRSSSGVVTHKRNLISKIREAKCFKSMNEIKGHKKCMLVLQFLQNIEGCYCPPLAPSKLRL